MEVIRTRAPRRGLAVLAFAGLVLLGLLFVPECDDCYFVYWTFDSLKDWLLTRPVTEGARIVGVPENGRYLGNFLGVLQGKLYFVPGIGPLVRGLLMGGALFGVTVLLSRRARGGAVGRGEALALAFALVLLAPRGIWQEGYSWGAGLVNYVLPLGILLLLVDCFAGERPPSWPLVGLLALADCLFLEPVTLLLAAAGPLAAWRWRKSPKRRAALALWLGSWLGSALMVTAPGYWAGSSQDRRVDWSLALDHLKILVPEALVFPAAATLLISILLVWLVRRRGKGWRLPTAVLVPLHLVQLLLALENLLGRPRYDLVSLGVGTALAAVWCWLLLQKGDSAPIWGLVLAIGVLCAPLLVVTPIGARNLLPAYGLLSLIGLLLYREARQEGFPPLTWLALPLSALALAGLVWIYGCNCLAYHQRLDYAQSQAAAGAEALTLPLLPFADWAINETVWKGDLSYLVYRETPWDVALTFVPWEEGAWVLE